MARRKTSRILAVAVTSRGVGFAVLEGPSALVDWGVKQPKPYREDRCAAHLHKLAARYAPDRIVVEDHTVRPRRCSNRVRSLFERVHGVAAARDIPARAIRRETVRKAFAPHGRLTKFAVSRRVAQVLPVLVRRLPPYRKP